LARAVELLDKARRYVGQSNSVTAMDLSQEMLEFTANYRRQVEDTGCPE
jgi:ubiquinone/menaquinone biosynthesis C-methylase UbiE